jgi:hypothetical protein
MFMIELRGRETYLTPSTQATELFLCIRETGLACQALYGPTRLLLGAFVQPLDFH